MRGSGCAYNKSAGKEGKGEGQGQNKESSLKVITPEKGGVYKGLYNNTKKTELCLEEGGQGTPYKWDGSNIIYSRGRT